MPDQQSIECLEQTVELSVEGLELDRERLLSTEVCRAQLLRLAMKGLPAAQAAKVVGCSAETARAHYRSPDFRRACLAKVEAAFEGIDEQLFQKQKSLHEKIEEQASRSCDELIMMVEDPDLHKSLKVKIHQDFMNRVQDSSQVTRSMKIEPADLAHAAKVGREMDNVIPFKKEKVG